MNNGFYQNGQYNPFGSYSPMGSPNYVDPALYEEKLRKERLRNHEGSILKTMAIWFGIAVISYVVLSFASSFVILFLANFFPKLNMLYDDQFASDAFSAVYSVLFIGLPFFAVYMILRKKKYAPMLPLGTSYNKKASAYLVTMMFPIVLISTFVINFISSVFQDIAGLTFTSGFEETSVDTVPELLMTILATAIVPAIVEEIAIRGIVMQPLRHYGDKFAIIASAFIFSLLHGNMVQIPYTLVAGIYFGYVAAATGSLWPGIILHFLNNLFSVAITYTDDTFGENASSAAVLLLLAVIVIAGIVGGCLFAKMNYKVKLSEGSGVLSTKEKVSKFILNVPMIIGIVIMVVLTLATSVSNNE